MTERAIQAVCAARLFKCGRDADVHLVMEGEFPGKGRLRRLVRGNPESPDGIVVDRHPYGILVRFKAAEILDYYRRSAES